ncbi:hypothetical protein ES332_D12G097000v1 [Gossypium tomentosum]|uniref:Cyclin C-terminal domain-containing protein n=1 Tax=Gossypium tomentosum TaxID=34277 RepID=A0A5D2I6K3_GOSTO|nr:hypothetical protein ES332_D12G097000v1 [Gossypium tomentosum]
MEENLDCSASNLLCSENASSCFDDDLDFNAIKEFGVSPDCDHHLKNQIFNQQDPFFINNRSTYLMGSSGFAIQSDDRIKEMVEKEVEHLPEDDYLKRLRSGDLDLSVRKEALDWIWKASAYYGFGPSSLCLSINYLDRFLSVYDLPVGEPKFVFEAKTLYRMEVLVLSTLKWKMQVITPCSFIDYFMSKICNDQYPSSMSISRSLQLILSTIKGIDFLEFRPSEIAAAMAISVSGDMQTLSIDKAVSSFAFVGKGRVLKCVELMKDLTFINGDAAKTANVATQHSSVFTVPQSPIGVLDAAACLSYKSDEIAVGSCANSSHSSPDIKRRKQDYDDNNNKASEHGFKS